jgi:hypothetical protein
VAWERPMVAAVSVATITAGIPVAWLVGRSTQNEQIGPV